MSLNKVLLIGHLGADPELRYTASQLPICKMRIATNDRRKNSDGSWEDYTEWHSVTVFGKSAENCGQYLAKGRQVFVEGQLRTSKWQDQDGRDRYRTEIIAQNVQFIGGRSSDYGSQASPPPSAGHAPSDLDAPAPSTQPDEGLSFDDDDIPF